MEDDDIFNDDELNSFFEESKESSPSNMGYSTFKLRNDTQELLFNFRLDLMNAIKKSKIVTDKTTGEKRVITNISRLKNTVPMANKQGVAEIMSYLENYINGHSVQTNFIDRYDFFDTMHDIADDITGHLVANREHWEVSLNNCDILIARMTNLIELFLRRGLYNKEREGYSESHKETVNRDINDKGGKPNFWERFISPFGRGSKP